MKKYRLNESERIQLKKFICLLGILLLVILFFGKLITGLLHRGEELPGQEEKPHIPVVTKLSNVWIMEESEAGIVIFRDGVRESYEWGLISAPEGAVEENGEQGNVRYCPPESVREQVADVILTDGLVTGISLKKEKINGRVLGADGDSVEIEGIGAVPLASDYKGYRLYDSLEMCTVEDLCFGYDFTDFCVENGEICGVLMIKEEAMEHIRVLVKAADYGSLLHMQPQITADSGFRVVYGAYNELKTEHFEAGEEITFDYESSYFQGERVWIVPDVLTGKVIISNSNRSQGTPAYRGQLELLRTEAGIAVINEVLLEEYLYSVVPSEMPAGYPAEALKAQAICARTYAYGHMLHAGYPQYGAHVDDSTSYQVYNNIKEQESTTTAVKDTYGQLLFTEGGGLAGTYYYSTSCGVGSDANVWKTEAAKAITYLRPKELNFAVLEQEIAAREAAEAASAAGTDIVEQTQQENGKNQASGQAQWDSQSGELGERLRDEEAFAEYINSTKDNDFEAGEGWYRWTYEVEELDSEYLLQMLQKRYAANSKLVLTLEDGEYVSREIETDGEITDIYVDKRGAGGVADELVIQTTENCYKVISEHNIRYVLNDGESKIHRQDGSKVNSPNLLPSGFFVMETRGEDGRVTGYTLTGGGFGHGVGMSQNGARSMAKKGYDSEQILLFFYEKCYIDNVYEGNNQAAE